MLFNSSIKDPKIENDIRGKDVLCNNHLISLRRATPLSIIHHHGPVKS